MVERARLESVYTPKGYPGFESLSLRNPKAVLALYVMYRAFLLAAKSNGSKFGSKFEGFLNQFLIIIFVY